MTRFWLKLSIFAAALLAAQLLIAKLYPPELPAEILRLQDYLDHNVEVIYLGDSTLTYPLDQITTAELLQELLPDYTIGQVAHPAYNLDLYRAYVDYIVRQETKPQIVIIPINLRSFSPEWDRRPGYQFEREQAVLTYGLTMAGIFYRPLAALGGFEPVISQDDFLKSPVFNGETAVGQVADFERLLGNDE